MRPTSKKRNGFSLLETLVTMAGGALLLTAVVATISAVQKEAVKVEVRGQVVDYKNYIKSMIGCAETLQTQGAACIDPTQPWIELKRSPGWAQREP